VEKKPVITQEEFRKQYTQRKPQYQRLATNIQQALKTFLEEKNISYLEVLARVKDAESAYEKVARKGYEQPFEEIEDWCGLRIICYYHTDIERICEVLKEEFAIHTHEDTAHRLASNEFGYRSTHFILQIKPTWAVTPNYKGLQNFKAEVQVRTILMHAWAEIEHKLAYKSAEQAPRQFRRKLSLLSAKFEEADEQFEELRKGISDYRTNISETITAASAFRNQSLNLDTLQGFLNVIFPESDIDFQATSDLVDDLLRLDINMHEIVQAYEEAKNALDVVEASFRTTYERDTNSAGYNQVGGLRIILDVGCDKYFENRYISSTSPIYSPWIKAIKAGREFIGKSLPELKS
jgi:ppGpp synthetase/RelA/SpoT-type nucleotidyltranferase